MAEPTPSPAPAAPATDPAAERLAQVYNALWADKDIGAKVRAKTKEMFPDVVTPEDNIDPLLAPVRAELAEMQETLKTEREARVAERAAETEARQAATMREQLDAACERFNLNDDGLDKMVARMKETGNYTDAEAAAAWVVQQTPPVVVPKAGYLPKKLDLFGSANARAEQDFVQLHTDPQGYMDDQLERFAQDPDLYVRETFAA